MVALGKNRPLKFTGLILLAFSMACVSGSIRPVTVNNELPKDLPQDLQDKFEIKEGADSKTTAESKLDESVSGKKRRKKGKKTEKARSLAKAEPPFVYPTRRPPKDPIWVGEHLLFSISYFGVSAGDLSLDILPFKIMNHRKVYHVRANAVSSAVFSLFYRLNDVVETFIDYEGNFSHRFHILLDETKQSRDALELYDSEKKQTFYWNRWHHNKNEFTESKEFSAIEPFSQDSLSALYYVRTIPLPTGSVVTFPVVSEGKGWEAVVTVLRREMVDSPMGRVSAVVLKPEMKYQGVLKKSGDSFLWLTDDDRRLPIRLEAKVKIGTVVAQLRKAEPGISPMESSMASRGPGSIVDASPTPSPSGSQTATPGASP